jgi:hypothetical protein
MEHFDGSIGPNLNRTAAAAAAAADLEVSDMRHFWAAIDESHCRSDTFWPLENAASLHKNRVLSLNIL